MKSLREQLRDDAVLDADWAETQLREKWHTLSDNGRNILLRYRRERREMAAFLK